MFIDLVYSDFRGTDKTLAVDCGVYRSCLLCFLGEGHQQACQYDATHTDMQTLLLLSVIGVPCKVISLVPFDAILLPSPGKLLTMVVNSNHI